MALCPFYLIQAKRINPEQESGRSRRDSSATK
jgi:hypothetical protein